MKSFMKTNRNSKFIIKREDWPFGPVACRTSSDAMPLGKLKLSLAALQ